MIVAVGLVVWVTLLGTTFEYAENNRFRFVVEPLIVLLFVGLGSLRARIGVSSGIPADEGPNDPPQPPYPPIQDARP